MTLRIYNSNTEMNVHGLCGSIALTNHITERTFFPLTSDSNRSERFSN